MLFSLCVVLTSAMPAAASAATVMVLGFGSVTCGSWSTARAKRDWQTSESLNWYPYNAWIQGYLTAQQTGIPELTPILQRLDADAITAWVDNYCAAHPLDDLDAASLKLTFELVDKIPTRRKK